MEFTICDNPSGEEGRFDSHEWSTAASLEAIIKVRQPNYVPAGVTPRATIDDTMITGSFMACDLSQIESDPLVESVAVSKNLRTIG